MKCTKHVNTSSDTVIPLGISSDNALLINEKVIIITCTIGFHLSYLMQGDVSNRKVGQTSVWSEPQLPIRHESGSGVEGSPILREEASKSGS